MEYKSSLSWAPYTYVKHVHFYDFLMGPFVSAIFIVFDI